MLDEAMEELCVVLADSPDALRPSALELILEHSRNLRHWDLVVAAAKQLEKLEGSVG
jgi:hypothetical protein